MSGLRSRSAASLRAWASGLALLVILLLQVSAEAGLIVQGFDPQKHDRFAFSPYFIGANYNWSGVGLSDQGRWGTLVSPNYVLSATHYPSSGNMRFYTGNDPNGPYVERSVVSGMQIAGSDLWLGRLSAPITADLGINYVPVAALNTAAEYVNQVIYTFGLATGYTPQTNQRLGRNQIDGFLPNFSHPNLGSSQGDVFLFDYDNPGGVGADEAMVQGGDSGGPSLMIINGQPALVGIHWFVYSYNNPSEGNPGSGDTFVPSYISEINAGMTQLNGGVFGDSLILASVPEPSSLTLLALASGTATYIARRRRSLR